MGLSFTNMHIFKPDHRANIDVDLQVREWIRKLDCTLKEWQIICPTPTTRVLYYITEESSPNPKMVKGYQKTVREEALKK